MQSDPKSLDLMGAIPFDQQFLQQACEPHKRVRRNLSRQNISQVTGTSSPAA
jgi:hypothetical protein